MEALKELLANAEMIHLYSNISMPRQNNYRLWNKSDMGSTLSLTVLEQRPLMTVSFNFIMHKCEPKYLPPRILIKTK